MRGSTTWAGLLGLAVIAAASTASPGARAQPSDVDTCANAAEESQVLRRSGKLTQARERLVTCARASCPGFIQKDCVQWLAEVEKNLPSIVLRATDADGKDVTNVRVLVDGKVLADKLDGRPLAVDPGEHVFTYETAGAATVSETVLIRQAEANRLLTVSFRPAERSGPRPPAGGQDKALEIPTTSWVLGGAGIVLAGVGAALWVSGTGDHSEMESGCARTQSCLQSDVDSAKTKLVIGDVALVGGIVAIGAAVVLALVSKDAPPRSALERGLVHRF